MSGGAKKMLQSADNLVSLLQDIEPCLFRIAYDFRHASADMVTAEIEKNGTANVTVASVYNILAQLALLGIYHHRMSANNKMYFDVNTFRHIHLYDYVNNTYKDVIDDDLTSYIDSTLGKRKFRGYKVENVDIQIVCRPSRNRTKTIETDENTY